MSEYKSQSNPTFRSKLAEDTFNQKYRHSGCETWEDLCKVLVNDVIRDKLPQSAKEQLIRYMYDQKFIPGGRYLYYAGRRKKFFNNCYLLRSEADTREDWADTSRKAELCLTTGGGIGNDYSIYRARGTSIHGTGGTASGPLAKMEMINEIGRFVIQGGSRRSAIYASLSHKHPDIEDFLTIKDWSRYKAGSKTYSELRAMDFNFRCPLDMTNVSVNYDTEWLMGYLKTGEVGRVFTENVSQALRTGEPGFSFNFFGKENETLRNACTEVTSEDDSDVCNLGSVNLSRISDLSDLAGVVELGTVFLLCGTEVADLPYDKVRQVRQKNRRLGLGLMGVHEWLLQRGYRYEVTPELHTWLSVYRGVSDTCAKEYADRFGLSTPVANRAIAPTGTIGMVAGTTTGIEPIYAVAYKRRYIVGGNQYRYQYNIEHVAQQVINRHGVPPDKIETSVDLAKDYERRIKFQADVQDYVDMGISSTINLPAWGDNDISVMAFAKVLASYANRLRGFTCYPDGARGGQPIVSVPYAEAVAKLGTEFSDNVSDNTEFLDVCDLTGHGGSCGV